MALLSLAGETETTSKANGIFNDFQLFIEFPASPLFLREKEKKNKKKQMTANDDVLKPYIHVFFYVYIVSFWNFGCLLVYTTKSLCDCYSIRSLSSSYTVLLGFTPFLWTLPIAKNIVSFNREAAFLPLSQLGIPHSNDMIGVLSIGSMFKTIF